MQEVGSVRFIPLVDVRVISTLISTRTADWRVKENLKDGSAGHSLVVFRLSSCYLI